MNLTGKVILITGGSSGIGLDAVEQFTKAGVFVIVCGRSAVKLEAVKARFPRTETIACDIADEDDVLELKEKVEALGGIDILYNNAGAKYNDRATSHGSPDTVINAEREVQTNYLAVIRLNELFIPMLEERAAPVIINTSSALAYVPSGAMPTYSASKAALHAYTVSLRLQLQKERSKIRVYELLPPTVDTPFNTLGKASTLGAGVVNKALLGALSTNRFEIRPGRASLLYYIQRLFPGRALKIINP
jgi:uncharacterized oxidoreductase